MLVCAAMVVGAAGLVRGDTPKYAATWPNAVLRDGEAEGKTMFGAEQRWISPDGEPVLFVHVVRADGKGVLRAVRRDNGSDVAQDVLVHAFGKDEMVVIARDDGALGFQFHSYRSTPNKYLGVLAIWKGGRVVITKQKPFTGYQPTPPWLFDPDVKSGPVKAWRAMRAGALTNDNMNGFNHWFDDEPVAFTLDGRTTTMPGKQLVASFAKTALPMLGNHVSCDAKGCCHGDAAAVAAWPHVQSVCFAMISAKYGAVTMSEPRVRSLDVASASHP
jgi:hypothetical protein